MLLQEVVFFFFRNRQHCPHPVVQGALRANRSGHMQQLWGTLHQWNRKDSRQEHQKQSTSAVCEHSIHCEFWSVWAVCRHKDENISLLWANSYWQNDEICSHFTSLVLNPVSCISCSAFHWPGKFDRLCVYFQDLCFAQKCGNDKISG